jgi:hypothetical protein
MSEHSPYRYGTPNMELVRRWLQLPPEDDGPFWALNLMKYRAVASYRDGDRGVSGREADDAYAPLGPLAAVGASVVLLGDVVSQLAGSPVWDRVGIVRYPTRAAFFAMQQRDDFKQQHVHKDAGMEFTIVMACHPVAPGGGSAAGDLVLVIERGATTTPPSFVVECDVEGVIVGDDRTFDRAWFVRTTEPAALVRDAADESHVLVVSPTIDRLLDTPA